MPTTKLFGYTIEETDDKLIISIDGVYATRAAEHLRSEMEAGQGWRALATISPMYGLKRIERRAMKTQARLKGGSVGDIDDRVSGDLELDLDTIFKQGVSNPYEAFETQLDSYRSALAQIKADVDKIAAAKAPNSAASAPKKKLIKKSGGRKKQSSQVRG
jgi:hypothetical protein